MLTWGHERIEYCLGNWLHCDCAMPRQYLIETTKQITCCTFGQVNLIGPHSSFTIIGTRRRFSVLAKALLCSRTTETLATMLNSKDAVFLFQCSHSTLVYGVLSLCVLSVQDRIHSFHYWNCAIFSILIASNRDII